MRIISTCSWGRWWPFRGTELLVLVAVILGSLFAIVDAASARTERQDQVMRTSFSALFDDPTVTTTTSLGTTPASAVERVGATKDDQIRSMNINTDPSNTGQVCFFFIEDEAAECANAVRDCDDSQRLYPGQAVGRKVAGTLTLCWVGSAAGQTAQVAVTPTR